MASEKAAQGRGGLPEQGRMRKTHERRETPSSRDGEENRDAVGEDRSEEQQGQLRVTI